VTVPWEVWTIRLHWSSLAYWMWDRLFGCYE